MPRNDIHGPLYIGGPNDGLPFVASPVLHALLRGVLPTVISYVDDSDTRHVYTFFAGDYHYTPESEH